MSKIEVRWEEDTQGTRTVRWLEIGSSVWGTIDIAERFWPALLAALLENAGADKHTVVEVYDELNGYMTPARVDLDIGEYWILPVPEDTE